MWGLGADGVRVMMYSTIPGTKVKGSVTQYGGLGMGLEWFTVNVHVFYHDLNMYLTCVKRI